MQPQSIASVLANEKDVSSTIYFNIGNVWVLFRTTGDKPLSVTKVMSMFTLLFLWGCIRCMSACTCGYVQILAS